MVKEKVKCTHDEREHNPHSYVGNHTGPQGQSDIGMFAP